MYELNARIATWREALSGRLSTDELNELEDHLREALAALPDGDLSPDERFLVATRRLGTPATLAAEFAKARPARIWWERAWWMVAGYVVVGLFCIVCSYLAVGVEALLGLGISENREGVIYLVDAVGMLLIGCLATGMVRSERGPLVAGMAGRTPGVLRGVVLAAVALLLLNVPGGVAAVLYPTSLHMPPSQLVVFANRMYWLALGNVLTNVIVIIGLIAAAPWLVARESGRAPRSS